MRSEVFRETPYPLATGEAAAVEEEEPIRLRHLDDSIQQCMERLLQSLGEDGSPPAGAIQQAMEVSMPAPSLSRAAFDEQSAGRGAASLPRDSGAEPPIDVGPLRELAEVAAKSAHLEYQGRLHARQARDKLLVALIALPCGLLLLYWSFAHRLTLAYTASGLALFVAACWGTQALRAAARLAVGRLSLARLWYEHGRRS